MSLHVQVGSVTQVCNSHTYIYNFYLLFPCGCLALPATYIPTLTGPTKKTKKTKRKTFSWNPRAADCFLQAQLPSYPITQAQLPKPKSKIKTADRRHDSRIAILLHDLHLFLCMQPMSKSTLHTAYDGCPQVARAHALARARKTSLGGFETGLHRERHRGRACLVGS
jgi:hypothetical protein